MKRNMFIGACAALTIMTGCDPWPCSPPTEGCMAYEDGGAGDDTGGAQATITASQICDAIGAEVGLPLEPGQHEDGSLTVVNAPHVMRYDTTALFGAWAWAAGAAPPKGEHAVIEAYDGLLAFPSSAWREEGESLYEYEYAVVEGANLVTHTEVGVLPEVVVPSIPLAGGVQVYYTQPAPGPHYHWRVHGSGARVHGEVDRHGDQFGPGAGNLSFATDDMAGVARNREHCRVVVDGADGADSTG